jgi:gas vesicle protein
VGRIVLRPLTISGKVLENSSVSKFDNTHQKFILMNAEKVLISALSGLVAGVAIGILVAPAEGRETRQKIADTADSLKRKLRQLRGVTSDELDELKDIFERETEGLRDDVRSRVLELIKAAKEKGNHIKETALS